MENRIDKVKEGMASPTKWCYHKSVSFFVAWMMIFLCLLAAKEATSLVYRFQLSHPYCVFNGIFGGYLFGIFTFIYSFVFSSLLFAFSGLFVFTIYISSLLSALFCSTYIGPIFVTTNPTVILQIIFRDTIFIKLRKWFNFLALRTLFCYGLLRHGFFLIKKLCLEPLQDQFLCGSLYYTILNKGGK